MCDRLPDQLARVRICLQQPDDIACDLAGVVVLDPSTQTRHQLRPALRRVWPIDGDPDRAIGGDGDVVYVDRLLALHADAVGHPELPVVPRASDHVAVEFALGESVSLVRAGMVDGVEPVCGAHDAHAVAVDLDHLHGADGDVVEVEVCVHGGKP